MKLVFILHRLSKGGVTSVLIDKLNYLEEKTDFEIHLISELKNDSNLVQKLNSKINIHVLEIEVERQKRRLPIIGYFQLLNIIKKEFQKLIDSIKPDIITGFNYGYNKEIIPFLKTEAIKIIELHGSYHSRLLLKEKRDPIDYFKKPTEKLQNLYDHAVVLTKEDLKDRDYLKIKTHQFYNGIKIPKNITPFHERENIILAIGTLTHNKNFIDLIKAIALIKDEIFNWKVHVYGEGRDKKFLQKKIEEYQLENIIQLKGFNYEIEKTYNNAKILVSTSISEGFSRVFLEAFSYKIPIISYNCKCGPKEIIQNEENGYLIDFDINILSKKILRLISNEQKLNDFSNNSYLNIDKFHFERIMKTWIEFYNNIKK